MILSTEHKHKLDKHMNTATRVTVLLSQRTLLKWYMCVSKGVTIMMKE